MKYLTKYWSLGTTERLEGELNISKSSASDSE
jgi:hypothetical protein